jgi:gliding motility-associated-like protein
MDDTTINYNYSIDGVNYQTDNIFSNLEEGNYILYVTDENNCIEKTIAFEIIITRFKAPKYFTPNNDGYNDYWQVLDVDNTIKQIQIFDRYGKLIKQIDPNSVGWDGTYNNTPLPTNDYWYLIDLHIGNTIRGHFTLKR